MNASITQRGLSLVAWMALAATATGCFASTSAHQALDRRVGVIEANERQRRPQVQEQEQRVATLIESLERVRNQLGSVADTANRMETLDRDIRTLRGEVQEIRQLIGDAGEGRTQLSGLVSRIDGRVLELERRTGIAPVVDPSQIPQDNAALIALANRAFDANDLPRVRALANALLGRAPQDAMADDARYLLGRAAMSESRWASAIQEFRRVAADSPQGDRIPDSLADMAECFVRLGWCNEAQRTLRLLIERYASSPRTAAARTRTDEIRRLPRAACTQ
ncbi:MAG: tetratricopeptide repeat protein [Deltaproteobacteria bacterium]|nr:tetratricopeptide repeat protein [Deltaproteobacteria bacterium]